MKQYLTWINGQLRPAISGAFFDSINPSNGEIFASVSDAGIADIIAAIAAARQAFDAGLWSGMTPAERGIYLKKIAEIIRRNAKELAELESRDTGKTFKQTIFIDVPTCADTFECFSNAGPWLEDRINPVPASVKSITRREPAGVVGMIIPWNFPLIMFGWKVAPALAAGNTIVFKPSQHASVAISRLAELISDIGLPAGVLNIVTSSDHNVGTEMIKSPLVDMISFTGGTETGKALMAQAAGTLKKLSLELGGKSPNIVFADCDMDAALGGTMAGIFMNQGQMCTAGSRLLLDEKIYDAFLEQLAAKTRSLKIGDSLDSTTDFGPVIHPAQQQKILKYIDLAIQQGGRLICGGKIPSGEILRRGYYIEPTILADMRNDMTAAQEEIFGPVLTVIKFSTEEQAVRIANDTPYGLAACVWSKDQAKANRVARQMRCGTVWVNTYGGFYNEAPFGGYKQSGFGRELGTDGLLEYTQAKHICVDETPGGKPLVAHWF
ncbi:MAG: aldehyde dehydrogenase family protein [Candidatus Omnitrophica bacterium]|nr:aldehyde dehydrogenase family protein [Candidatus Omnitrophota bacterium]